MKGLDRRVDQELFHAAEQGNISEVEKLFSLGADVLARNNHHTVLHSAVLRDNENLLKLFLDKIKEKQGNITPFIDAKDTEGDTPLMWTAESKYINAARILLEYGADVAAKNNDGMTALHWAAKKNHIHVVKLLIAKGAEVNVKDKHGKKPSDYAREEGHKEVEGYLLFSFAEILRKQGLNTYSLLTYQKAISIQEAVLGPDHLDTLMTRENTVEVLFNLGKHAEALQLFQKVYDIRKRTDVLGGSKSHEEVQKLDEEYLLPKRDELETIKKDITDHLEGRLDDVYIVRGKNRGKNSWFYALIDPDKKDKFLEKTKTGSLDVSDYGKTLFSGWGENPPESIVDKVTEFFNKKVSNDFFVTKEKYGNKDFYHYGLIDPNKRKVFQEELKKGSVFIHKIQNCGSVLYSGWGQEPPENISFNIISAYFSTIEMMASQFLNQILFVKNSKFFHDVAKNDKLKALESFVRDGVNRADQNGWTLLHHAAYIGNLKVVNYLIESGANLHVKDIVCGRQPLHIAARVGHKDVVEFLLNKSLDVFNVNRNNWTSLHYAAWSGNISVVKLLIDKGFDIHAKEATRGKNPIHIAAERGFVEIVDLFLKSGAEIDDTDKEGRTSLYYASLKGHLNIVKYLAGRGANIHAKTIHGIKPIHTAAMNGHINIIVFLVDRRASITDITDNKCTLLYLAAENGQLETVCFLLNQGANVNKYCKNNDTPLHRAARFGYLEVVKILLKKGAKIEVRNEDGKTPSDLARENGYEMIADILDFLN